MAYSSESPVLIALCVNVDRMTSRYSIIDKRHSRAKCEQKCVALKLMSRQGLRLGSG